MQELQLMDRLLIKRIMELPKGASTAGIHLEMGLTPVKFLIKGKRLMFLHYLLTRDRSELLSKVYYAQKAKPVTGDWSELIKEDLEVTGLNKFSEDEIKGMKKSKWKKIVKILVRK